MSHAVHEDSLESEIQRLRERLAACPSTSPQRGNAFHDLAASLYRSWKLTGRTTLLDEAIELHREALALRPYGHPDHAESCNGLGNALRIYYEVTGATPSLDESITLHQEALALRPHGHPDRATSCSNLACSLRDRYLVTGGSHLLDEIIKLHREALALRAAGNLDRAISCSNLASSLRDRYQVTGGSHLLDEVITLHREALALIPDGHLNRATSCNNLANALGDRYRVTGSSHLLDEVIKLHREALALQPTGHPDRALSCNNLAEAMQDRYQVTGSSNLLDDIVRLQREALTLRPSGHPEHEESCNDLAYSLWQDFRRTKDVAVVDEALALAREAAASASLLEVWRALLVLVLIHIEQGSPHFSISTATEYLLQASKSLPWTIIEFMREVQSHLDRIWRMHGTWTPDTALLLLNVYSNIIDGLSPMTGFAFDAISQLTALRSARSFGSDACVAALLSGRPRQAIELLDRAHGIIWAQALHQRDPQLQDIPHSLASELEALFRAVSMPVATPQIAAADPSTGYLSPEDIRYQQNSRIQTILKEVRAMPGLERFMLGRTYAQLRETAREHPVVVLVSARGQVYVLVIRDATQEAPDELHLKITSDHLSSIRDMAACVGLRQGGVAQDLEMELERAMHISGHKKATALDTLADLWHGVVKPVVDHLQLQVRIRELRLPLSV
jgi:tetratricopeptide (TPR) repeat protein